MERTDAMKIVFTKQFKFSPNGYDVETYEPSKEPVEVSDECGNLAIECGCAEKPKKADK